jgi:hypothetical protein
MANTVLKLVDMFNLKKYFLDSNKSLFSSFLFKGLGLWRLMPLLTIFSYIVAVSFIGGGNRSTLRKPLSSTSD